MDPSKLLVVALVLIIAAGAAAWSYVNFAHTPDYDPEKAHLYLEHFYHRCTVDFDEETCGDVIGDHHRSCFTDHLRATPADEVDDKGPVLYDLETYLRCMDDHLESTR